MANTSLTRRRFLGSTSAGLAGVGLLALLPRLTGGQEAPAPSSIPAAASTPVGSSEPLVAYVHNPAGGEIAFMAGTHEVRLHDPELVSLLVSKLGPR
jgi:hypothetical protein